LRREHAIFTSPQNASSILALLDGESAMHSDGEEPLLLLPSFVRLSLI
jgi:hypothetical protein